MTIFRKLTGYIADGTAVIALALGACMIGYSSSGNSVSVPANAAPQVQTDPNQRTVGKVPTGWRPGSGTIITGESADRAKTAAQAKYPEGTVNRVLKLSDGSYAVHMIKISWPHHVFVSKKFKVTGAIGAQRTEKE